MISLDVIRRQVRESIDLDYYDKMFAQHLLMAGDKEMLLRAMEGKVLSSTISSGEGDLPDYGEIMSDIGRLGAANHAMVNARIMAQGLNMQPQIVFRHSDSVVREYNEAYILKRWMDQRWDVSFYLSWMELEANGIGSCHAGITEEGRVHWRHVSNLDVLRDRGHKEPSKWRWVAVRNRLSPEECEKLYGDVLSDAEMQFLTHSETYESVTAGDGNNSLLRRTPRKQVVEWSYFDRDHHVIFLGGILEAGSIALGWSEDGYYRLTDEAGPNPYGVIPHAWMIDSWAPSVHHPVSKSDTSYKIMSLCSGIEQRIIGVLRDSPRKAVDTSKIDLDWLEKYQHSHWLKDMGDIIPVAGNASDAIYELKGQTLDGGLITAYQMFKAELNPATGVGDMQRGSALGGERRTREEIRALVDASGIQARYARQRFARFVEDAIYVTRAIGAQWDTAEEVFALDTVGEIDSRMFPKQPMLLTECPVQVDESSLMFRSDEERKEDAIQEFNLIMMPGISLGVLDPQKVMNRALKAWGIRNPLQELGFDPNPLQVQQPGMQQMPGVPQEAAPGLGPNGM